MTILGSRHARRLLIAILVLVAIDWYEPVVLRHLEEARYENPAMDFRFENSDLFGVGPLVSYLREHPRGRQPRVAFFGNSITYGYALQPAQAVPGHFQRLSPTEKVLNVGVNGFEAGSAFLVAKAAIDAIDQAYVLSRTDALANPKLPEMIPVEPADLARFGLSAPDPLERRLSTAVSRWRLYRDSYRLQAALFGASARQYIYLNKGRVARGLVASLRAQDASAPAVDRVVTATPMAAAMPSAVRVDDIRRHGAPMLWDFAELFATHDRQIALLQLGGYDQWLPDAEVADFNRAFHPNARIITVHVPVSLTFDRQHLTDEGALAVATALVQERQIYQSLRP